MAPLDDQTPLDALRAAIDGAEQAPLDGFGGGDEPPVEGDPADDLELARYAYNDSGNAARLLARFGTALLYVDRVGLHTWDGKRYGLELGEARAKLLAQKTGALLYREVEALRRLGPPPPSDEEQSCEDDKERARMAAARMKDWRKTIDEGEKWAVQTGNAGKINGMLEIVAPRVTKPASVMDANPWLLNIDNGTLNLRERPETTAGTTVRRHSRDDLLTKLAPVRFDPEATCPIFDAFLARIQPDAAVRGFLQRLFGYCLTGDVTEQVFVIFHGEGANGKSTLTDLMREVFGDYAATVPAGVFMSKHNDDPDKARPSLAKLPGVRLLLMSEPKGGAMLDESLVKAVTGMEPLPTRNLHEKEFDLRPVFKPIMSTNHKPGISGQDTGIWRRVKLVPFEVVIPEAERDRGLPDRLREEKAGVFNWLLDGLAMWWEEGLNPPEIITAAVDEWKKESDPIGEFLEAETYAAPKERVKASVLYEAYAKWCEVNAKEPLKANSFGRKLRDRGLKVVKSDGVNNYLGLQITPGVEPPEIT